ncbi:CHASE domain-containing protein [Caldimonas sp.]|uniref:CHASE domain-containing protein n=1 Tax=Caldimonas sp. TaxID=2838790 RepID=UPI00391CDCD8
MHSGFVRTVLLPLVVTAAGYAALSAAALSLALPQGFASPWFPAAGWALACTLVWGHRAWLTVVLTSAVLTHVMHGTVTQSLAQGWVVPAIVGLGAGLQAWLGASLVRRRLGQAPALEAPGDILRFMLLAGPVACVVSASAGTLALGWAQTVPSADLALSWWTWWCGDTLGVLVAAPVVLSFIAQPQEAWRPRRLTVALPLAAVTLVMALAIHEVGERERQRRDDAAMRDAVMAADRVQREFQRYLDVLDAMHGLFVASEDVARGEFRQAAQPWLSRLEGVQALGWHRRVRMQDLPAFEAQVQAEGLSGFQVFNRRDGLPPPADEAMVMHYIEPMAGNATALGVNVLTIPAAAAAIERARREDRTVASAGFRLTQETHDQVGVVLYRPIYEGQPRSAEERLRATRGLVFLTLRMDDTLRAIAGALAEHLSLCMVDRGPLPPSGAAFAQQRLAGVPGCESAADDAVEARLVDVPFGLAGREWMLRVRVDESHLPGAAPWNLWAFAMAMLLAATMLSVLLLTLTGRTRRFEAAVRERTAQLQREIAERSSAEVALRESEQRLRNIFNTVPAGIVYTDLQGRIIQANPGFCQITGYSAEELSMMSTADLTDPQDRGTDTQLLLRMASGELPFYRRTKRYITRDGQVRWVRVQVRPLFDAQGRPYRTVGVVEDISERLRLEEAERARELAEAANRAKSDFLSRMSHELRTPLNAMLGFAQLLGMDAAPAWSGPQREWLAQIQKAGWHLLEMINDVLDLSRIDLGTVKLHTEALPLRKLLKESVALVQAEALQRGVRVEFDEEAVRGLAVMGDATRVKQILTNLLSNAVKYNREGGRVWIEVAERPRPAHPAGAVVDIHICDTGMGLSEEQLAHLFEPFNRLGRERSGAPGTGIGLVISRRLAEGMGGQLRAQSVEGQGSTFTLELPSAAAAPAGVSGFGELGPTAPSYGQRRVHYIEDNEINAEVMRGVLSQRPQIQLSVFATGAEGLAAIRSHAPDLVLLDLHLPDMHGLEVLQHLRSDPRTAQVPVVVVSADALQDQIEGVLRAGAQRYLTKPVDVREVLSLVDELLGAREARPA